MIESLGGYRLVRKLGEGPRAAVYLAHPHRDSEDATPAAIKIFHAHVSEESVTTEAEALSRSAGQHVAKLLDVTRGPDGLPALVLSRCANGSVGRLVRERVALRPGEAITTLAPLAAAVSGLHDAGVRHGAIGADAVLFDHSGTPTLARFGTAVLAAAGMSAADRECDPGLQADLRALQQLVVVVLELVRDDATAEVVQWLRASSPAKQGWLEALSQNLFDLGQPLAVDLRPERTAPAMALPTRIGRSDPMPEPERTSSVLAALNVPDFIARLMPASLAVSGLRRSLIRMVWSVRPRFWVATAIVGLALLLTVVLIPQDGSRTDAAGSEDEPANSPTASDREIAEALPAIDAAVSADEPLAAALALLVRRDLCLRDMSVLCLDRVAQPDSAAASSDRSLIESVQSGAELPSAWVVQEDQLLVVERLGNSAIVSLGMVAETTPASLLLMKGETGWRIRAYLPPA